MKCNAKITTATVTDETVARLRRAALGQAGYFESNDIPDGAVTKQVGDRLVRVDLHETPCVNHGARPDYHVNDPVRWSDDTPGATPHEDDVTVSDAEVSAMFHVAEETHCPWPGADAARAMLLAAKRASKEQP